MLFVHTCKTPQPCGDILFVGQYTSPLNYFFANVTAIIFISNTTAIIQKYIKFYNIKQQLFLGCLKFICLQIKLLGKNKLIFTVNLLYIFILQNMRQFHRNKGAARICSGYKSQNIARGRRNKAL